MKCDCNRHRGPSAFWLGVTFWALVMAVGVTLTARAQTPEEKGLAIATEADQRDMGWGDLSAELRMVLRNRNGDERTRRMSTRALEVADDGDKTLVVFNEPRDVKGTAFLSFSHRTGDDDQWLYLPALKRVKRITSSNKSGPFMGSEFAYEDISSQEVDKYTYKWLRDEELDGVECFVVERIPLDKGSGYTRQVTWIDKAEYRPWKIDFYDRKESLLKTLAYSSYKQYGGKFWRADVMEMTSHQTLKGTRLEWVDYAFGVGLDERDFDKNSLKRAR